MALNLLRAGYDLTVGDKDTARLLAIKAEGAALAEAEVSRVSEEVVVLCLPGPDEVEEVALGPMGVINGMSAGASLINVSTVSASLMRRLDRIGRTRDVGVIDAPMTGGVDGARAGSLTFMVGAEDLALARVEPILTAMASKVRHIGPVGTGSVAKLVMNMLWFAHVVALADGMAAGIRAGILAETLQELIQDSAANSAVAAHDLPRVLKGETDDGFTLALSTKDLRLAEELMRDLGVSPAVVSLVRQRYEEASRASGPSESALMPLRWGANRLPVTPAKARTVK